MPGVVAVLIIVAVVLLIGGLVWLAWAHRSGAVARGVAAAGTRYNGFFGLGAGPNAPAAPTSALPQSRCGDSLSLTAEAIDDRP